MDSIPFSRPGMAGEELNYIAEALGRRHASGDDWFMRRCHALLEGHLPGARALLTTSCTHALEMAAILLNLQPGDEVIVPSFTFVSTANAFVLRGALPVFADIRPDTLNIDERQFERLLTDRTRAVIAVHYAGVACEMDALTEVAASHRIAVVEDNAHGLFGTYRGRALGTLGQVATLSFHETKNITCGEGGALLLNDRSLIERAEVIREKGTNRSSFLRGEIDAYTWVDLGSSYRPSDILAAFLCAQLEQWSKIQSKRRSIWERYARELAPWAAQHDVALPYVPPHCQQPFHLFYLLLPSAAARESLRRHMTAHGIVTVSHYVPLHLSPMGQRFGGRPGLCPVTEDASARLLRLPLFLDLTDADQARVLAEIHAWRP